LNTDDPAYVLRNKADGNLRAIAMRRLKEPAREGRPQEEQDEMIAILEKAATTDPSPIVRTSAIQALGRFQDPRAVNILINAYHQADGAQVAARNDQGEIQASAIDPLGIGVPIGFPSNFRSAIRSASVEALGKHKTPESVVFLGRVASGEANRAEELPDLRDVRAQAVRSLTGMHDQNAVVALAKVLQSEARKDLVLARRTHEGLVQLTGKNLPPDPEQWQQVVQAGFTVTPPPNAIQRALHEIIP
jgi:HEAT repeat protein